MQASCAMPREANARTARQLLIADPDNDGTAPMLHIAQPRHQRPLACDPYHTWETADGAIWLALRRIRGDVVFRFPGLADFVMSPSEQHRPLDCRPVPGVDDATCTHLFRNQVWPLVLDARGELVFHGSAVTMGSGAIAFLGASGLGKSTLAATFASQGGQFLGDDCLHCELDPSGACTVRPAEAAVRLWHDAAAALFAPERPTEPSVSYTSKMRFGSGGDLCHCDTAQNLDIVYFLENLGARDVTFRRLSGVEAHLAWVRHSFLIDPANGPALARHCDRVAGIAASIPAYALDFPRDFARLDQLTKAITAHAKSIAAA